MSTCLTPCARSRSFESNLELRISTLALYPDDAQLALHFARLLCLRSLTSAIRILFLSLSFVSQCYSAIDYKMTSQRLPANPSLQTHSKLRASHSPPLRQKLSQKLSP